MVEILLPSLHMLPPTLPFLCVLLLFAWLRFKNRSKMRSNPFPPGPRKLPLIGSALSIPSSYQWIQFAKWAKAYGSDLIHLDVFGTSIVVLNSYNAASDLLEKRSSIYSNRPKLIMATEIMGWKNSMFFKQYDDTWRAGRRLLHEQFNSGVVSRFRPQQTALSNRILLRLLESPADFSTHIRSAMGAFSMSLAYGIDVLPERDPLVELAAETLAAAVQASNPGSFLVDFIPLLKHVPGWLPGASFVRNGRKWKKDSAYVVNSPFIQVKRALADGVAVPSFTRTGLEALEGRDDRESREAVLKFAAADIYVGAADTSVAALHGFFLGMLANPQAMRAAQAELDSVIKPGFLPSFEDEEHLPYISAIVSESIRWHTINPIAIPHSNSDDDVYHGYRIPADSIIIANIWAMTHDENEYPDPFAFRPERFLTKEGALDRTVRDPRTLVFGFGRRICPGMHLGTSLLWIIIASILNCFDIAKARDEAGVEIEPTYEGSSGLVSYPKPFKCSISPRSSEVEDLIKMTTEAF